MGRLRGKAPRVHWARAWRCACVAAFHERLIERDTLTAAGARLSGAPESATAHERSVEMRERWLADCEGRVRGHYFRWREVLADARVQ